MTENIDKYDRLLFISSTSSIKSNACQFELSNGRIKQDKFWKTILFPIHIDDFLFKVEKEDIRPREKQEEYWKNIQELRDINSLDFSEFNNATFEKTKFENKVKKIINEL